jgi:hypothetical protein
MIKRQIDRWEFEDFAGHFEPIKNGWIEILDAEGNRVKLHVSQILEIADTLKEEVPSP